jgi:predicted transposase YdaD
MAQAVEAYRHVSAAEEFRQLERLRENTRRNEASALGHARREGMREGIREGMRDVARRIRNQGKTVEETSLLTGLTIDEVLRL